MITIKSMLMNVSHAGLALVYVLLELRKKLNHHKKKRTKLPLSGQLSFCTYSKPLPITPSNHPFSRGYPVKSHESRDPSARPAHRQAPLPRTGIRNKSPLSGQHVSLSKSYRNTRRPRPRRFPWRSKATPGTTIKSIAS